MIHFHFLTLFPEVFSDALGSSLLGKAQKKGLVSYQTIQIRQYAQNKHHSVDDSPYGGGEGMLLKVDVLYEAWRSVVEPIRASGRSVKTLLLSPQGSLFQQQMAHALVQCSDLVLVCGHYEGVDERFIDLCVDQEVSIGDYVLTGGELPALVVADTVTRLIPEVVGNDRSLSEESLESGLLKYPQYTRPREFQGKEVPDVLLQGNHVEIAQWRKLQSLERTQKKRPDLWKKINPSVRVE